MKRRLTMLLLVVMVLGVFGVVHADWRDEKITLSYASWADTELEEALLQRFMEKYPNVTVTKDASIDWPWNETLAAAASAGNMPDVFYVFNIPVSIHNEWLRPLDDLWAKDPDAALVYEDMGDTAVYHDIRYAAPSFQFMQGVLVNKTLFEEYNIDLPDFDWTIDDMIRIAREIADPHNYIFGFGGEAFHPFFPAMQNHDYGWNTWDGEKFNFTDPLWIDAYNTHLELMRLKVKVQMTPEERLEVLGSENANPFQQGHVAMLFDMSWALGLVDEMKELGTGEIIFYPTPRGAEGHRTYVVPDYIGLSSITEHPEAAFELMKWMSFGREGLLARLELIEELGKPVGGLPVADYPDIWDIYLEHMPVPGFDKVVATLDNTFSDVFKWLPGINDYHNYVNEEQLFVRLEAGEANAADVAPEFEKQATKIVQDAINRLK